MRAVRKKVNANPFSGPGLLSVPIAMSPGGCGLGPQLSLSCDAGAGHGPLGPGWSVSPPAITRKADKDLSKFRDAEKYDVCILSGAEDLVPVLKEQGGKWVWDSFDRTVNNAAYNVVGNFLQMQHCGSDGAHPPRAGAYRASEHSHVKSGKQPNRVTSTAIGWASKTYGGGDGYRRHTSESAIKRRNGNDGHSIVYGGHGHPLRSRRAIGPGGLGLNPGSVSVKENMSSIEEPNRHL